jgi:ferredoxin
LTPFGLRKRLREALGTGAARASDHSFEVELVMPDASVRRVRAEPRYTLVMASQTLETPIATACPDGACGLCAVEVQAGADSLAPPTAAERDAWKRGTGRELEAPSRLACHARVVGPGARVRVTKVWKIDDHRGS